MPKLTLPDKSFWSVTLIAVICGLAAGILGAIASRLYILDDFYPSDVDLSNLNANNSGLVIRDPKNVTVSADVKVAETVASLQPVIVGVFEVAPEGATGSYYDLETPLFIGLIITADGWVIAQPPEEIRDFAVENYVAIASDRRLYQIDRLGGLTDLPGSPLVFRLSGASNLPVKKILPRHELSLGETLLVVNGRESVWSTMLTSLARPAGILSSDILSARLTLSDIAANSWQNSFVFDMAGDLAAVISADEAIIPAFSYGPLLTGLTQVETAGRPALGINYLDLSAVVIPGVSLDRGALVFGTLDRPAIVKDSAAEKAGIQAGDVITWVNNQELNDQRDLSDLLAAFRAGEKITLTYQRSGQENTVEITLGEMKIL